MGTSTATNIVGGEISGWAALLEKWAMQDQYEQELKRQAAFRDQALGQFNTRVGTAGAATAQDQMAQGAANRMAMYNAIQATPSALQVKSQPRGNPARDAATAQMLGQDRANLGKYSDWGLQQTIQNLNTQRALAAIESKAGGQAGVYPYRMYDAQHSQDTLSQIGQAISSIGGGSANYSSSDSTPQGDPATGGAYPGVDNSGSLPYGLGASMGQDYSPPATIDSQGNPSMGGQLTYNPYGTGWTVG